MVYEYEIRKGENGVQLERGRCLKKEECVLDHPSLLFEAVKEWYSTDSLPNEYVFAVALSSACGVLGVSVLSVGSVNEACVSPMQVLQFALLCNAPLIALAHNHPSGMTNPSKVDLRMTERIDEACKLVGIELADHVIIGKNTYWSWKETKGYEDR